MPIMPKDLAWPSLVTCLALFVYFGLSVNVGRARGKYNVPAPQVSGNPDFERVLRVQQNTVEQIITFLPSLWICALLFKPTVAAALGGVWILGRIVYAWGYYKAAEKRGPGFGLTALANFGLLGCATWGAVSQLL
jgi:glutathione S-transferase